MSDFVADGDDSGFSKNTPDVQSNTFSFSRSRRERHACGGCSLWFQTKFLLNLHRATRCSRLPCQCDTCELRFSSLLSLKNHQKIHSITPQKVVAIAREKIRAKLASRDAKNSQKTLGENVKLPKTEIKESQNIHLEQEDGSGVSHSVQEKHLKTEGRNNQKKTQSKLKQDSDSGHQQKGKYSSAFMKNQEKFLKKEALNFLQRQKAQRKQLKDEDSNAEEDQKPDIKLLKAEVSRYKKRVLKKEYAGTQSSDVRKNPDISRKGPNLFSCEECHLSFPGILKLERHMRIHSGKRAFQCKKCHLAFYWKSNYNRHVKTHCSVTHSKCASESKYACVTCGRVFNRRFSLFRHRQTRHPEEFQETRQPEEKVHQTPDKEEQAQHPERDVRQIQHLERELVQQTRRAEELHFEDEMDTDGPSQETEMAISDEKYERIKEEADDEDTEVNYSDEGNQKASDEIAYYANMKDEFIVKGKAYDEDKLVDSEEEGDQEPNTSEHYVNQLDMKSDPKRSKSRKKKFVPRRYQCDVCGIYFRWKCDLNRHRSTHSGIKAYPCDKCDLGFNWKSNLTRHQRRIHCEGIPTHRCDMCGQVFVKRFHFARHVNMYCSKRPGLTASGICKTEEALDVDLEGKPDQEVVVKQETASAPESPEEILPDINPNVNIVYLHLCQNEGSVYKSERLCENIGVDAKQDVPVQLETENSQKTNPKKEFVCSKCSRVFLRKTCYVQHERSHDKQPLKCQWCGRDFSKRSELENHARVHMGEGHFTCEFCDSNFMQESQLMHHLKTHAGDKPFECHFCKVRFGRKALLDRHRMIHTGEKPYKCEYCDLAFNQRCSLVLHQRVHVGEKHYKCGKCDLRFAQRWSYDRHKERVHFELTAAPAHPKKRRRTSNKVFDHHVYNTRFALRSVSTEDNQDVMVDIDNESAFQGEIKGDIGEGDAKFVSELKPNGKLNAYNDNFTSNQDKFSKSNGKNSDEMLKNEYSNSYKHLPATNSHYLRNQKIFNAIDTDQGICSKKEVGYRIGKVFAKKLTPRKDIDDYKSESINEFLKSFKQKHNIKDTNISKNRPSFHITKARCSEEVEISEGLANVHIGHCKDVAVNDNRNQQDIKANTDSLTVESPSLSESTTHGNGRSYTKQGIYIFQDIITVENSVPNNSDLKCKEDLEVRDKDVKDQECGSTNDKNTTSNIIQTGVNLPSDKNPQKTSIEETLTFNKSQVRCQELFEKNETAYKVENILLTSESMRTEKTPIKSGINENEASQETVHVIRVSENLSNLNAYQQEESHDNDQNTECQTDKDICIENELIALIEHQDKSELSSRNSNQTANCEKSESSVPHQEQREVNFSKQIVQEIGVCKDNSDQKTILGVIDHEVTHVSEDNRNATNITSCFSKISNILIQDLSNQNRNIGHNILVEQEGEIYNREMNHSQLSNGVQVLKNVQCPRSDSLQNDNCTTKIEVTKNDFDNCETNSDNDYIAHREIEDSLNVTKLHAVSDSGVQYQISVRNTSHNNNNGHCAVETDIAQKYYMPESIPFHNIHSNETNDLIDEVLIDTGNDGINEVNSDCISESNANNKDYISEINDYNNDCIREIPTDESNDCNDYITNEPSYDCSEKMAVNRSKNFFKEIQKNEIRYVQRTSDIPYKSLKEIQTFKNNTFQEITPKHFSEKNIQPVLKHYIDHGETEKCFVDQDLNNYGGIHTKFNSNIISDNNLELIRDNFNPAITRVRKEPFPSGEFAQYNTNRTFIPSDENIKFPSTASWTSKENESNRIYNNQSMNNVAIWKQTYNSDSNDRPKDLTVNRNPASHFEIYANNRQNDESISAPYTGDPNPKGKSFILDLNDRQCIQLPYRIQAENESGFQNEANRNEIQYRQYPIHQNFASSSSESAKSYSLANANEMTSSFKNNQWNQHVNYHNAIDDKHALNMIPSSSRVQDTSYETDIDEESIRYAVQTVQAIIQSDGPVERESVNAPIPDFVRYEVQNFHVPAQYPVQNDGYGVQGLTKYVNREGILDNYRSVQPSFPYETNIQPEQYGARSCIDPNGGIAQYDGSHFAKYPNHRADEFAKRNPIVHKEQGTASFEEGFLDHKPLSDLIPAPKSSNLEFFPYERAPQNCVQNVPYESVEVTETVYTNLELASYENTALIPYKGIITDSSVMHKEHRNIVKNIQYKDTYPHSTTSEKMYTTCPQVMRTTTELAPNQSSFHYETYCNYPSSGERYVSTGCAPQIGKNVPQFENTVTYKSLIPSPHQNVPGNSPVNKEFRNSIVLTQYSKNRRKVRKSYVRPEAAPKKTGVTISDGKNNYLDLNRQKSASIDLVHRQSANVVPGHQRRSSCDQVQRINSTIDRPSLKRTAFDKDCLDKRFVVDQVINDSNNKKICNDNLSKNISPDTITQIGISEKAFECDKCNRSFVRKSDLIRHRFTEHQKNRPMSSFVN